MAQGDRGLESEPGVQGVGGDPEIERQGRPESQWRGWEVLRAPARAHEEAGRDP